MADLRRPAARAEARELLASRISDQEVRTWALDQIDADDINRVSIHVRPGISEPDVLAAWRGEVDAERAAEESVAEDQARLDDIRSMIAGVNQGLTP